MLMSVRKKLFANILIILSICFMVILPQVKLSFAETGEGNLALGKKVTASSNIGNGTWNTSFLTDGVTDRDQGWSSNTGSNTNQNQNEWVVVDLGDLYNLNRVNLYPRTTNNGYSFPIDFTIDISDDYKSWKSVVTKTDYQCPVSGVQSFDFEKQSGRYVRVNCTKMSREGEGAKWYRMQFYEMEVIGEVVKPDSVEIVQNDTLLKIGNSIEFSAVTVPENAITNMTWESNNKDVATVSSTGVVTPISEGSAEITVTTDNGKTDTCKVYVVDAKINVDNAYEKTDNGDGTYTFLIDPSKIINKDNKENTITFFLAAYNKNSELVNLCMSDEAYTYNSYTDDTNKGTIQSTSSKVLRLENISSDSLIKLYCWEGTNTQETVDAKRTLYHFAWENPFGYPKYESDDDVLNEFIDPPSGYGEVGFYWWSGKDPITKERIKWQLDRLKDSGVSGMQVNYFHTATGGNSYGLTYKSDPEIFSDEWWDIYGWFMEEANKQDISVSLSDYTLCTPGQGYYTDEIIKENPEMTGKNLTYEAKDITGGTTINWGLKSESNGNHIKLVAYKTENGNIIQPHETVDLTNSINNNSISWNAPEGTWKIIHIYYVNKQSSLDPMNPMTGKKIVEKFFQPFENRFPDAPGDALNFFFSDEFELGIKGNLWNDIFLEEFKERKGYDLYDEIEAIFVDIGSRTSKIKLDYNDVLVSLTEEGTYIPIYNWHRERGILFGCDHGARGTNPLDYGDYFRIIRWYTGPGNDQPRLGTDIIKPKVSSSISHLYERPRTWLEGYYGSGWSTNTDQVSIATFKNFAMGSNLLTLHGMYYSAYGGYMEWAPPDNHVLMPYWEHFKTFLSANERLSYLMSQGVHRCDVAIMYPVAPSAAGLSDGKVSTNVSFDSMKYLYNSAVDADFIDAQSIDRAEVETESKTLNVSGEEYKVIVVPSMRAINYTNVEKLEQFYDAGGIVISIGKLPEMSDRIGSNDEVLDGKIKKIFGYTASEAASLTGMNVNENQNGGKGIIISLGESDQTIQNEQKNNLITAIDNSIQRDFRCNQSKQPSIMHRVIGSRDVYMVYGANKNTECQFRAKGKVELWDPWTGKVTEIINTIYEDGFTKVRMPLSEYEVQLIVFSPEDDDEKIEVVRTDLTDITSIKKDGETYKAEGYANSAGTKETVIRVNNNDITLSGEAQGVSTINIDNNWRFEIKPTLDNTWGDYRLPAFEGMIGAEARTAKYMQETEDNVDYSSPDYDDSSWDQYTYSYGGRFWKLGPLPDNVNLDDVESKISKYTSIDPNVPVNINGTDYYWQIYSYSDRLGVENYPGVQGYHGLKGYISDDYILLGKVTVGAKNETFEPETDSSGKKYLMWTAFNSDEDQTVSVNKNGLAPSKVWINGNSVNASSSTQQVQQGNNYMLLRFDNVGRGRYSLETDEAPTDWKQTLPLAMSTYQKPGVLLYDIYPEQENSAGWYRFTSAPGTKEMTFVTMGVPEVWADGEALKVEIVKENDDGSAEYRAVCDSVMEEAVKVAVRIEQEKGYYGGGALVEPIKFTCEEGVIQLGDWSTKGEALYSYSGGAYYRKTINVTSNQLGSKMTLNLGDVVSTAEVIINGKTVATKVTKPWSVDISGYLNEGDNELEILVYNTLSNHYTTIPTSYRGSLKSGLMGPVSITVQNSIIQTN